MLLHSSMAEAHYHGISGDDRKSGDRPRGAEIAPPGLRRPHSVARRDQRKARQVLPFVYAIPSECEFETDRFVDGATLDFGTWSAFSGRSAFSAGGTCGPAPRPVRRATRP